MDDIGFFFEYKNQVVQIPINPAEIGVSYKGNNESKELINLGQITDFRKRKLSTISFSSFFPEGKWFPALRTAGKFEAPKFYKDFFTGIMNDGKECRFIVTGIGINMLVSVESFDFKHQAGEHEDAYYTIELKEYKPYTTQQVPVTLKYVPPPPNTKNMVTAKKPTTTKKKPVVKTPPKPPVAPKKITVGSLVWVTGDIYSSCAAHTVVSNLLEDKMKVIYIMAWAQPNEAIYQLSFTDGEYLGWAKESSVELV